jgi:hypothetical protein
MITAFATDLAPTFGPHNIISLGEVLATLIVLGLTPILFTTVFTWLRHHTH